MSKYKLSIIVALIIMVMLVLTGCNNSKEVETSKDIAEAFSVKYKNTQIVPGTEFIEEKIDEKPEFSEIPSCAFDGTDKVYTYSGVEITVAKFDNKDKVYSVYFLDDSVETEEGVKITDSTDTMIEKYGENYAITMGTKYTYTKGDVELSFIIENDVITSIEYTLKTN